MKIYSNFWKIISNNCVVFILIALHLIHFIFENLWINIIIETNQKVKADKKHGLLYIFGNKNQHKFSKTTQNYCIIYARSLHFIYLIFENLWMNIITENCRKIKADKKNMTFCTFLATKININLKKQLRIVVLFILEAMYSLNNILKM